MNLLLAEAATTGSTGGGMNTWVIIVYVVLIGAMMYFMIIKPQKKQRKEQAELMNRMEVGDSVMTTAGFYGVIIDMTDDTVIVEFGNNKNCRIPMQKQAIVQIEKPADNG
ncbi:MAG: preprotein translocase subunit YajC [Lachnospiraceae bacterium]|nr:preprotein translocase subunit YajC [Lachnospiraceae bacterium]